MLTNNQNRFSSTALASLFTTILLLSSNAAMSAESTQRDILLALYNDTNGASWTNNTDWLGAEGTECSWYGVECDTDGKVIGLNLKLNNLVGSIPTELDGLSLVQYLDLGGNQLSGAIPESIAQLTNLNRIWLWGNQFTGAVPTFFGGMTQLTHLALGGNQFSGPIPASFGNLVNLLTLDLAYNQFNGSIPEEFANLVNATTINLSVNQLSGTVPASVLALGTVNLWGNNNLTDIEFGDPAACAVQTSMTVGSQIEGALVPFEDCYIDDEDGPLLADFFRIDLSDASATTLFKIEAHSDFYHPRVGLLDSDGTEGEDIVETQADLNSLFFEVALVPGEYVLYIHGGSYQPQNVAATGAYTISTQAIAELQSGCLRFGSTWANFDVEFDAAFTETDCVTTINDTSILTESYLLSLKQDQTVRVVAQSEIASQFRIFNESGFVNGSPIGLPNIPYSVSFTAGQSGRYRVVMYNTLNNSLETGAYSLEIGTVPESHVDQRTALISLYNATAGDNWTDKTNWLGAEGTECTWFGVQCDFGGNVSSLMLRQNNLVGSLPNELASLSALQNLDLGGNQLSGTIPSNITQLLNLKFIYLWGNQYTGPLPLAFGEMPQLNRLSLGSNQFDGVIPASYGNLVNLLNLDLAYNYLTGSTPSELGNLINATEINLNNNLLTGDVPQSVKDLGTVKLWANVGLNINKGDPAACVVGSSLTLSNPINGQLTPFSDCYIEDGNQMVDFYQLDLTEAEGTTLLSIDSNSNWFWPKVGLLDASGVGGDDVMEGQSGQPPFSAQVALEPGEYVLYLSGGQFGHDKNYNVPATGDYTLSLSLATELQVDCPSSQNWVTQNTQVSAALSSGDCLDTYNDLDRLFDTYYIWLEEGEHLEADVLSEIASQILVFNDAGFVTSSVTGTSGDSYSVGFVAGQSGKYRIAFYNSEDGGGTTGVYSINFKEARTSAPIAFTYTFSTYSNFVDGEQQFGSAEHVLSAVVDAVMLDEDLYEVVGLRQAAMDGQAYNKNSNTGITAARENQAPVISLSGDTLDVWICPAGFTSGSDCSFGNPGGFLISQFWPQSAAPEDQGAALAGHPYLGAAYRARDVPINLGSWSANLVADSTNQFDILVAFYDNTGGENWTINTNWRGAEGTECSWYGVTCDGDNKVIGLELNQNNLVGSIPGAFGNLSELRFLSLGGNQLNGIVPSSMAQLENLTSLQLWNNNFNGNLPTFIAELTQLEYLGLGGNPFNGTIPASYGDLVNIRDLQLSYTQLSGNIPAELANLVNATTINLSNNQLSGPVPAQILSLGTVNLWANPNLTGIEFGDPVACENQATLTLGAPIAGELTPFEDCYIEEERIMADFFRLDLRGESNTTLFKIDAYSDFYYPHIGVLDANGQDGQDIVDTQIQQNGLSVELALPPGEYVLYIHGGSYQPRNVAATGAYTLNTTIIAQAQIDCVAPTWVAKGVELDAALSSDDCLDTFNDPDRLYDSYNIWLEEGESLITTLTADFESQILHFAGNDFISSTPSTAAGQQQVLTYSAPYSGWHRYAVYASNNTPLAEGDYTIAFFEPPVFGSAQACTEGLPTIALGGSTSAAALDRDTDCYIAGRMSDRYALSLDSDTLFRATMDADGFTPLLSIYNAGAAEPITLNGNSQSNFTAEFYLAAGEYWLAASSGASNGLAPIEGSYELSLTAALPISQLQDSCMVTTTVFAGASLVGEVNTNDCRNGFVADVEARQYFDGYEFTVGAGEIMYPELTVDFSVSLSHWFNGAFQKQYFVGAGEDVRITINTAGTHELYVMGRSVNDLGSYQLDLFQTQPDLDTIPIAFSFAFTDFRNVVDGVVQTGSSDHVLTGIVDAVMVDDDVFEVISLREAALDGNAYVLGDVPGIVALRANQPALLSLSGNLLDVLVCPGGFGATNDCPFGEEGGFLISEFWSPVAQGGALAGHPALGAAYRDRSIPLNKAGWSANLVTESASQRDTLIALYNSTGGDNWTNKTNWLGAEGTECSWYGVQCDGDENVTQLNLEQNNLVGSITAALGNLLNATTINLSNNQLTGTVPAALYKLDSLETLNVAGNNLAQSSVLVQFSYTFDATHGGTTGHVLSGLVDGILLDDEDTVLVTGVREASLGGETYAMGEQPGLRSARLGVAPFVSLSGDNLDFWVCPGGFTDNDCSFGGQGGFLVSDRWSLTGATNSAHAGHPTFGFSFRDSDRPINRNNWVAQILGSNQHDILITLYNATGGDNWTNKTNWLGAEGTECSWYGVQCDGDNKVTALDLNQNNLVGSIPSALGDLSTMQFISLGGNQLSGAIPNSIAQLENLRGIFLWSNQFNGSLPEFFSQMTQLRNLNLSGNQFTGTIPASYGNLVNMLDLDLAYNQLSGSIPAELGNLVNATKINLQTNQLSGAVPAQVQNLGTVNVWANPNLTGIAFGSPAACDNQTPLALGAAVDGELTPFVDCYFDDERIMADFYRLDLSAESGTTLFRIDAHSDHFYPHVGVLDANGNDGQDIVDTRIQQNGLSFEVALPPGEYVFYIHGGSYQPQNVAATGAYTLSTQSLNELQSGCLDFSNTWVTKGVAIDAALSADDCVDTYNNLNRLYDDYTIWLEQGESIRIDAQSQFNSQILAFNEAGFVNGSFNGEPNVPYSTRFTALQTGWYRVAMYNALGSDGATGAYTISFSDAPAFSADERAALVALYDATDGANWTNKNGWLGDTGTECSWFGVSCDGYGVIGINLIGNGLVGTIPSELSQLSELRTLHLSTNQLTGNIPAQLGQLSKLNTLSLYTNQLTGSIPVEFSQLSALRSLSLFGNQLSGSIPAELGQLSELTFIGLQQNQLSGSIPSELGELDKLVTLALFMNQLTGSIPTELGQLVNLKQLYLFNNQLTGSIPTSLGQLSNLTTLYLQQNQLSGTIPSELGQLSNLLQLYLFENQLDGSIPAGLGQLSKLTHLGLRENQLSGAIPVELGQLTNLTALILSDNLLTGSIPTELGNLSKLQSLYIAGNQLSGSVPTVLTQLNDLTILDLSNNNLTGLLPTFSQSVAVNVDGNSISNGSIELGAEEKEALIALYNATGGDNWTNNTGWLGADGTECSWFGVICDDSGVVEINLLDNGLVGTIPTELSQLSALENLKLGRNQLTGNIPVELGQLSNLIRLHLFTNQLSGPIPVELSQLSNLLELFLGGNQLSGSIPSELAQLSNLGGLVLYSNQLSGSIPTELGALSNLKVLYLYNNQLTGSIPTSLGQLSNLTQLLLHQNQLSGPIPEPLGQLSNLEQLTLQQNQLSGSIPEALTTLNELTILNLSNNNFTGYVPEFSESVALNVDGNNFFSNSTVLSANEKSALIALYNATGGANWTDKTGWLGAEGTECSWFGVICDSTGVVEINLIGNGLTGTVPSSVSQLVELRSLRLYNNQLTGSIPSELGQLSKLTRLYLYNNQLSGAIPTELGQLTNLGSLGLNQNQLSEPIPASLGQLSNLVELHLQQNQLSGSIPVELGQLSNLTRLSVHQNQLTGAIPSELGQLSNLTHLYLHQNELSGSIPSSLGQLSNLIQLFVHENQLTGSIPSSLGQLNKMTHLVLSFNSLSGEIPTEFGQLTSLQKLFARGNQFTGAIPAELAQLSNLTELYLADNQLSGSIPSQLTQLNKLTILDLENNNLTGALPAFAGSVAVNVDGNSLDVPPTQQVYFTGENRVFKGVFNKLPIFYNVTDGDTSLTGVGMHIYYDSSQVDSISFANVLGVSLLTSDDSGAEDSNDSDNDPSTDRFITIGWADVSGNWPGSLPVKLFDLRVKLDDAMSANDQLVLNFVRSTNTTGYELELPQLSLAVRTETLDVDGNGEAEALTDGLIIIRRMFGFSGAVLIDRAIADDAVLTTAEAIVARVQQMESVLDVDGDGKVEALTDGLLIIRYLFGFRGNVLVANAIGSGATRTTASQIEEYLAALVP